MKFNSKLISYPGYFTGILFLCANLTASTFPVRFNNYSTEQGLSQNTVFCVTQDKYGFMWFGTRYGLNRFDGYHFKTFYHDPQDSLSLSHNIIQAICEDSNGDLWIGTEGGGLDRFDQFNQQFENFSHRLNDLGSLSSNHITSLLADSRDKLWVGTKKGLNRLNNDSKTFTVFLQDDTPGLADDNITCLTEYPAGILWIGTASGYLVKYNIDSGDFTTIHPDIIKPNRVNNNFISALSYNQIDSTLWIAVFPLGVYKYNINSGLLDLFRIDSVDPNRASVIAPYSISVDQTGNVWICSVYGLTEIRKYFR